MRRVLLSLPFLPLGCVGSSAATLPVYCSTCSALAGEAPKYAGGGGGRSVFLSFTTLGLLNMAGQSSSAVSITGGSASLGLLSSTPLNLSSKLNLVGYAPTVVVPAGTTFGQESLFFFGDADKASIAAGTTTSNPLLSFLDVQDVMNSASVTGDRSAGRFELSLTAPSGNAALGFNAKYQVLVGENRESVNDGGIAEPGDYSRWNSVLGNTIASTINIAGSSAAAFAMIAGLEVDSTISSSNGAYRKVGFRDSLNSGDLQRGAGEDAALVFSKAAPASSWKDVIEIGSVHGFPVASDSTILAVGTENGTALFDAAWGIDMRGVTFGSDFLGSNGFYVDGSGNMAANALVAGEVTSVTVASGGDYAPGNSGSLCPNLATSSLPTITMSTPATGLVALLGVNQWSPDPTSITIASGGGGANNSAGDVETIAGTKTKVQVVSTGTIGGLTGVVTSISVMSDVGSTFLFPSSTASPWMSSSNNTTATGLIPPTFCIGEFQINSVKVLRPGWGYQGTEAVTITPASASAGSLVAQFSSPIVTIDGVVNVDPPPVAEAIQISGTKVLGIQRHGWTGVTGTVTRGAFNTTLVTQTAVAQLLGALIQDLSTHGLIAP